MDNRLKIALGIIVASYVVLTHEEKKLKRKVLLVKKLEERELLYQLLIWMRSKEALSMSTEEFEREYKQRTEFIRIAIRA
jgi:hypothetical protein